MLRFSSKFDIYNPDSHTVHSIARSSDGGYGMRNELLQDLKLRHQLLKATQTHPNLVPVLGVNRIPPEDSNTKYGIEVIQEKQHRAVDFQEFLKTLRFLSLNQRLQIVKDICAGVSWLHRHGIVHRDIKPDNILFCKKDNKIVPKLYDFEYAAWDDSESPAGKPVTLMFTGPEVWWGVINKFQMDIYTLTLTSALILTPQIFEQDGSLYCKYCASTENQYGYPQTLITHLEGEWGQPFADVIRTGCADDFSTRYANPTQLYIALYSALKLREV